MTLRKVPFLFLALFSQLSLQAKPIWVEVIDPGFVGEDWINRIKKLDPTDEATLEDEDAVRFVQILTRGMTEQAFTIQRLSLHNSAILPGPKGLSLGLQLVSFPRTPPPENNVGKTENTQFIPFLPLLEVGYVGGNGDHSWSVAFSGVPPVTAQGATATVLGVSGDYAFQISPRLRTGLDLDYTVGQALAPVVATKEQYEAGELDANTDPERYESVCAPQEFGCIDTLLLTHLNARAALLFDLSKRVQPYVKLGLLRFDERFHVQVDASDWRLRGSLPQFAVGTRVAVHSKVRSAVEFSAAYRPWTISELGAGLLWRISAGAAYSF